MVRDDTGPWRMTVLLLGALAIFAFTLRRFTPWIVTGQDPAPHVQRPAREPLPPPWLLLLAFALTVIGARARYVAGDGPVGLRVYLPWLGGIVLLALAAWYPAPGRSRRRAAMRIPHQVPTLAVVAWAALFAVAAIPRFLRLDRGPDFVNEDEGRFILMAMAAQDGSMANPFASGWLHVPQLYPALQGRMAGILGTDIAAYRTMGALLGVATVMITWRLGRRLVGEWPAYAGAMILATMPFHLRFSRTAMNHVTDSLTLVLSLLFLARATRSGRRGDALLAGIAVGLGWYGYWGARIFPLIVAVLLGIAATHRSTGWRRAVSLAAWASIGFLATTAPLLMTYRLHPAELRGRLDATSGISGASLRDAPWDTLRAFVERLRDALLMPVIENNHLFYLHEAPFLGWPVALLLLAGIGVWFARLDNGRARRPVPWLLVPWGVIAAGIALTEAPQSQRAVALAPIWALAAGTGFVALLHLSAAWAPRRSRWSVALIAMTLIAVLGVANLRWYMHDDRQRTTFGADHRTLTAWDLGWRLDPERTPNPPRILFAGPPFMFIEDWGNLRFQAPGAELADVGSPFADAASVPDVPVGAILVLLPERTDEMCAIVTASPHLVVAEARARDGSLLYVAFSREGSVSWHPGTTPAGSTIGVIPQPECAP